MLRALITFAIASTLVTLLPGPDFMLVLRNAFRGGRRVGWCTAAGTTTGLALWAVAATVTRGETGYDIGTGLIRGSGALGANGGERRPGGAADRVRQACGGEGFGHGRVRAQAP